MQKWHHHAEAKTTATTLANHWKISFHLGPTCGKDKHDCTMKDIHENDFQFDWLEVKKAQLKMLNWDCLLQEIFKRDISQKFVLEQKNAMKHLNVLSSGNMALCVVIHSRLQHQWRMMTQKQWECKWQMI